MPWDTWEVFSIRSQGENNFFEIIFRTNHRSGWNGKIVGHGRAESISLDNAMEIVECAKIMAEDRKSSSATDQPNGGESFRQGMSFDLRDISGIFSLMGFATKDDVRELRDYTQKIEASLKADVRELRSETNSRFTEMNSRIDKVQDELHGIKGMVAKWMIGTVLAVVGTMVAQTTLILSAIK